MPSHVAPTGHYNDDIIRRVRDLLVRTLGNTSDKDRGQRIYISRARASKRKITNEAAVLAVLERYGFRTVYPEDLLLEEQVKLFSRVQYLVSNHGAGLANMLFVPEGACVLELRQQHDAHRNFYFSLAAALNQKYFYQICPPADVNVANHLADLIVDTVALEKNVRLLLEAGAT
jgi:capsular polysaccharide biosynthesis protein